MAEYVDVPKGKKTGVDGFTFLGLGNFTSLITGIKFINWGETVLIDCVYNVTTRLSYRIVFSKCYDIKWFLTDSDLINDIEADVIDFQIFQYEEKQYAYFHTDIFDISINYGSIKIEKTW